ncbi:MAG: sulfotransferase [Anaerolineaceae bacterium]|jgi:hypothetical protein|nr:sulfotransferase [Anaerolineaceae bacterium]OQY88655.1 MAG: hypothetical protein B6D38_09825 [Anaerolineae bacterium UTCFX1]
MTASSHPDQLPTAASPSWRTRPYLIIGGTTKAATTALFTYVGAHPEVCISSMKETRFFLDRDYSLKSKYRFEDGIEKYAEFFQRCDTATRLWAEATPDYLYSAGTPKKIQQTLEDVFLVFILREPKARVDSWYRFAKQNNLLAPTSLLDEFVALQLTAQDSERLPQHLRAVEQGRYAVYLRPYFETFGKERISVIFTEELALNPQKTMRELCRFVGIDPAFYAAYKFETHNRTVNMKQPVIHSLYKKSRFYLKKKVHNRPAIHSLLRRLRLTLEPFYLRLNRDSSAAESEMSPQTVNALNSYYEQANEDLTRLLGRSLPWDRGF